MLLIDNQQVNVDKFVSEINRISKKRIPLDEIKHNMEFKFNPLKKSIDLAMFKTRGMKVPKIARGADVLASFNAWDPENMKTVNFRFANRSPYTNPKNPTVLVHDPKAIEFPGGVFSFEERDLEKVVYLYANPNCFDSPLREKNKPYKYSHNNLKAASRNKAQEMNDRQKAFMHATNVDESEVKVLAIGLGLQLMPHADATDIRAELQEYAMNNPKVYLEKTSTETVKFEGMIQEALDSGRILKKTHGSIVSFEWGMGSRKGDQIMVVSGQGINHTRELKQHMKQNIADYYNDLAILNRDIAADAKAEQFLRMAKQGAPKEVFTPHVEKLGFDSVVDFNSAKAYLASLHPEGGEPAPRNASEFYKLVASGDITAENVDELAKNYIKKS